MLDPLLSVSSWLQKKSILGRILLGANPEGKLHEVGEGSDENMFFFSGGGAR